MAIELEHGRGLIISGAQGTGKTRLAIDMAKEKGVYSIIEIGDLFSPFRFADALNNKPDVVIVDDVFLTDEVCVLMKNLIAEQTLTIIPLYKQPAVIPTPIFIFCVSNTDYLQNLSSDDGRFEIIHLTEPARAEI